jgi:hypothetical protein
MSAGTTCVAILEIHFSAPLDHLIHFFAPGGFAEALLHDNARLVTAQARGRGLFLRWPGGQLLVGGELGNGCDG